MEDPIGSHPTRAEQLDILACVIAEQTSPEDHILDLGCGTGYVAQLIFEKRPDLRITGVDLKEASLVEAKENLSTYGDRTEWLVGNLEEIERLELPNGPYRFVLSALTFHDLSDEAKAAVISFASKRLMPGGYFILYDRIRLTDARHFPLQQTIWRRIEREYKRGMRTAESFEAYEGDLAPNNRPARLSDYYDWFAKCGMKAHILHMHGNVALLVGCAAV